MAIRAHCALDALEDMCKWLEAGGEVGVSHIVKTVLQIVSVFY